jgi:hypothetical protein
MCHQYQVKHGNPGNAYHNKKFSQMMEGIGLITSSTGEPGGRRTGKSMTHYIKDGGAFDVAAKRLFDGGFNLYWREKDRSAEMTKKAASKTKFTCSGCGLNVWGKPDVKVICSECDVELEPNH